MKVENIKKVDLRRNPWKQAVSSPEEGKRYYGTIDELREVIAGQTDVDFIYFKKTEETLDIFKSICEFWEDASEYRYATYSQAGGLSLHDKLDDYRTAFDEFIVVADPNKNENGITPLSRIMYEKQVTTVQLAEATGIPKRTLDRYRTSERSMSLENGIKIADALNVHPRELLKEQG